MSPARIEPNSTGEMPTMPPNSGSLGSRATATIAATAPSLAIDLAVSTIALGPKRFFAPAIGFRRLGSGLSALPEGLKPTMPTLTATPASTQASAIGATASRMASPAELISVPIPCTETMSGERVCAIAPRRASAMRSTSLEPKAPMATIPASSTIATCRSFERATWPRRRASLRRLGVAFSVLSPAMSGHPDRLEGGADVLLQLAGDPPGDEGQRRGDEQEADDDLGREADREDVELRHDARDDAEGRVGEDQREHHRAGDLQRGGHDPGERRVHRADEAAEVRRFVEAD